MNDDRLPVITVDGPSGSGKGTVGCLLAQRLGWHFLDSGALYRLVGLAAERHGIPLDNEPALATLAEHLDVEFEASDSRILLEGEDVSDMIRSETAGNAASRVAALPAVRQALLVRQRAFLQAPGLVADGRDMGTVVFPEAPLKIFLTASQEERAARRYNQLKEKGMDVNLSNLLQEIAERDARDASRTVAPLKPASDAEVIDSTSLTVDEVVDRALVLTRQRLQLEV